MNLTLTGIDEKTSFDAIERLTESAHVELGILYTYSPDGRHRYPGREWVKSTVNNFPGKFALHVCGKRAVAELFAGELHQLIEPCQRIQVNGRLTPDELLFLCYMHPSKTIITQHTLANQYLIQTQLPNHALLLDHSGGRGILPAQWLRPVTDKAVGFAGGLGPHNLVEELPEIAAVAQGDWWVDMESSLRDENDWFSEERAQDAVRIVEERRKCQKQS